MGADVGLELLGGVRGVVSVWIVFMVVWRLDGGYIAFTLAVWTAADFDDTFSKWTSVRL